jgi:hypothetical protein
VKTENPDGLTGRELLAWLTANPRWLDLPVMLLPMTKPLSEAGDALVAEEIDYDVFNIDTGKKWIVISSEREVGDDE